MAARRTSVLTPPRVQSPHMELSLTTVQLVITILSAVGALIVTFVSLNVKVSVATLRSELAAVRSEIAIGRADDYIKMRDWMNGSFIRTNEVEPALKSIQADIAMLHGRISGLHKDF